MHNHTKGAFLHTIKYMKYLSIYLKGMWKAIRYTNLYMEELHSFWDVVQANNDEYYA